MLMQLRNNYCALIKQQHSAIEGNIKFIARKVLRRSRGGERRVEELQLQPSSGRPWPVNNNNWEKEKASMEGVQ